MVKYLIQALFYISIKRYCHEQKKQPVDRYFWFNISG